MEKARLESLNTAVKHENESGLHWLPNAEVRGSLDIIRSITELWSPIPVQPLSKLVSRAEVTRWYIIFDQAHVALGFAAFVKPGEVRIDVGLAPTAAEWPVFAKIHQRHLPVALSIVVLRRLRHRLHHDTKSDPA